MQETKVQLNPLRPAIRKRQAKRFLSIYSWSLSYCDQFAVVEFLQIPVPPYGKIVPFWGRPAVKG